MTLTSRVTPSLLARDMSETLAFYRSLGFRISGGGVDTGWLELTRDEASLQFYSDPPVSTPTSPIMSGTIYFYPSSVDALAAEWKERVKFEWGPEVMDYGMREFGIRDPNGYYLAFTESATPSQSKSS